SHAIAKRKPMERDDWLERRPGHEGRKSTLVVLGVPGSGCACLQRCPPDQRSPSLCFMPSEPSCSEIAVVHPEGTSGCGHRPAPAPACGCATQWPTAPPPVPAHCSPPPATPGRSGGYCQTRLSPEDGADNEGFRPPPVPPVCPARLPARLSFRKGSAGLAVAW